MKVLQVAAIMVIIYLTGYFLKISQSFATPLVLAVIICFFIIEIAGALQQIRFKNYSMPDWLSMALSIGILGSLCGIVLWILNANIHEIIAVAPEYQQRLLDMIEPLQNMGILQNVPTDINQVAEKFDLAELFKSFAEPVKVFAENIIMIVLYSVLILLDYRSIMEEVTDLFKARGAEMMLKKINSKIKTYVVVKSSLNLLAAVLAFGVMAAFGLDFAPLWALLIFLMHFVPVVGGIVSFALPLSIALVQFGFQQEFFVLLFALGTIMMVVGHFLEPKMMGMSLNLRPVVIVAALFISNQVWGMLGMLLCIPAIVILKIILDEVPEAKPMVNLISAEREAQTE